MSRSRRKNPFIGHTVGGVNRGEKDDKQIARRRLRRGNKTRLRSGRELRTTRETSNPWSMRKDGKSRFDPIRRPEDMRK